MNDVNGFAEKLVGNWQNFGSFWWSDRPEDAEKWTIVYTQNRDSDILTRANHISIESRLEQFFEADSPNILREYHSHWGCGWIEGYAIRVYDDSGEITPEFMEWVDIRDAIEDYPILDEELYSNMQYEESLESLRSEYGRYTKENAPDGWENNLHEKLQDDHNDCFEDQYPETDRDTILEVMREMGILDEESV